MRVLSKWTVSMLVLSLAAPATLAAASGDPAQPAAVVAPAAVVPASAVVTASSRALSGAAIARAAGEITKDQGVSAPIHSPAKTHQVRQQGGGSKAGMITALVATVGGLVGTIYMINYMKDAEKKATTTSGS